MTRKAAAAGATANETSSRVFTRGPKPDSRRVAGARGTARDRATHPSVLLPLVRREHYPGL